MSESPKVFGKHLLRKGSLSQWRPECGYKVFFEDGQIAAKEVDKKTGKVLSEIKVEDLPEADAHNIKCRRCRGTIAFRDLL